MAGMQDPVTSKKQSDAERLKAFTQLEQNKFHLLNNPDNRADALRTMKNVS